MAKLFELINELQNGFSSKSDAAEELGRIGDIQAVEPLINALVASDYSRQWKVSLEALDKIDHNWPQSDAAHRQIPGFIAALNVSDLDICWHAANILGRIRDVSAVDPLIATLQVGDLGVRLSVVDALSAIGAPAVEPMITALMNRNSNNYVLSGVAEALGMIRDAKAIEPLIATLNNSDDKYVRSKAAKALGIIGDANAVEPLISILKGSDVNIHTEVVDALGKIGDARAFESILSIALQSETENARKLAKEVLQQHEQNWLVPCIKHFPHLLCEKCMLRASLHHISISFLNSTSLVVCRRCGHSCTLDHRRPPNQRHYRWKRQ